MIEPTINGDKLTWTDGKYNWVLTGVPAPGPEEPPTEPPPSPPPTLGTGIWLSREEIMQLPMTGAAWTATLTAANKPAQTPDLSNQDSAANVTVLAQALVYVRTSDPTYKDKVLSAIRSIINNQSENGGRTLALGRELAAYVVAADLIKLDPAMNQVFSVRLRELPVKELDGMTLRECHEKRPNNWGTHAGASRAAVAAYLGDRAELDRCAFVFRGWLGDQTAYRDFKFGDDLSWQVNPQTPVAVNPPGATKDGRNIDGVLPEEMRRAGGFKWPPPAENYFGGALQGAVAQAWILHRQGYPVFEWQQKALLRTMQWWHGAFDGKDAFKFVKDDAWFVPIINKVYATSFHEDNVGAGKNMGYGAWTHG